MYRKTAPMNAKLRLAASATKKVTSRESALITLGVVPLRAREVDGIAAVAAAQEVLATSTLSSLASSRSNMSRLIYHLVEIRCGQQGHIARACPNAEQSSGGGGRGGYRNSSGNGGGSGFASNRTCYNCGGTGHLSRDCTSAPAAQKCFNCGETVSARCCFHRKNMAEVCSRNFIGAYLKGLPNSTEEGLCKFLPFLYATCIVFFSLC